MEVLCHSDTANVGSLNRRFGPPERRRERGEVRASTNCRSLSAGPAQWRGRPPRASSRHSRPNSGRPRPPSASTRSPVPLRPHSSLGVVRERSPAGWGGAARPEAGRGFDVVAYLRERGTESAIRVGVNGEATRENFFAQYLRECRSEAQAAEETQSRSSVPNPSLTEREFEEEVSQTLESSLQQDTGSSACRCCDANACSCRRRGEVDKVPLCWEEQLQQAKVRGIG